MNRPRLPFSRRTLRDDSTAGLVLGAESVPDGLASGLLAGVNPVFGLYAYMFGTLAGGLSTGSTYMAVQATGAMSMIVADVTVISNAADPSRALFTLSILTGVVMVLAGVLRLGTVLRFVSNAVMVGFINAVGVNIVLGQLESFTGYVAAGSNRVGRALDTLFHLGRLDLPTVGIGLATVVGILVLERTRLGPLGMVVSVVVTSGAAALFGLDSVAVLNEVADIPNALPRPTLPDLHYVPSLLIPAASLAFVGLVQGAAITAGFPNPDGTYGGASRDFIGQGAANVASGVFRGMPVGGSMSASSLVKAAGARSHQAMIIASLVMAIVVVFLGELVGYVAMPALAGLLMLVGVRTINPANMESVVRSGAVQAVVFGVTFVLTMLIPLQYAVLVGGGLSLVLYVVRQSNQITVVQRRFEVTGEVTEVKPPLEIPPDEVVVLQPYGSLFFASAPVFQAALPAVTEQSRNSVVILRLRGRSDLGTTFIDVLNRFAIELAAVDSKLVIVSADERLLAQFEVTHVTETIGPENIYPTDERVGHSLRKAHADAVAWVASNQPGRSGETHV